MKSYSQRGMLTDAIQEKAKAFLGREITQKELRLYPYIDYLWKNNGIIDCDKVDMEEYLILADYSEKGFLDTSDCCVTPTREFYDYVQDVLAEGYVILKGVDENEN